MKCANSRFRLKILALQLSIFFWIYPRALKDNITEVTNFVFLICTFFN